ncbi:STAS domain-containing protein [Streptomyces bambusae]|uniref:Anti-sigma factor antagonist n=1 Tax=Streptomyces bambusae TaxID=1550616 RepID=A0ABS6Z009_9ACTN|nr:STAS domain-containing protein [Streptomyces bambusae]MBW5481075.1 anti-sigma factor antagonist [Streptomyces bambusae]
MTIEWQYAAHEDLGVLSLAGYLGAESTGRFTGAVGWALARGNGPVILDLTRLLGWSAGGQMAVAQAARELAEHGRSLELAAIPADGSLVPDAACPHIPVHADLPAALAAHRPAKRSGKRWSTGNWPTAQPTGAAT